MPPTKTWKNKERAAAAKFGAKRNVLSGSSGRDDRSRSDSTHPTIFLECKYRKKHAVRELWEKTADLAAKEGKIPVVALSDKGRHGQLFVIHEGDLEGVLAALAEARDLKRAAQECEYEGIDDGA